MGPANLDLEKRQKVGLRGEAEFSRYPPSAYGGGEGVWGCLARRDPRISTGPHCRVSVSRVRS